MQSRLVWCGFSSCCYVCYHACVIAVDADLSLTKALMPKVVKVFVTSSLSRASEHNGKQWQML
jgi:hypothetical protein